MKSSLRVGLLDSQSLKRLGPTPSQYFISGWRQREIHGLYWIYTTRSAVSN